MRGKWKANNRLEPDALHVARLTVALAEENTMRFHAQPDTRVKRNVFANGGECSKLIKRQRYDKFAATGFSVLACKGASSLQQLSHKAGSAASQTG